MILSHKTSIRPIARLLAAALTTALTVTGVAHAQDDESGSEASDEAPITWGIVPSSATGPDGRSAFDYDLDPGESIEDYVGVSNFTDVTLELAVYANDAYNTAAGDFDLLPAAEAPVDVGAWVEFAEPTVTVPPRSRLDIPFRLTIPDNATPGDHVGGIVASLTRLDTSPTDSRVAVDRRVGSRIYLRVSGDLAPAATISDVRVAYDHSLNPAGRGAATVDFTVTNTGNVRVGGAPTVEISGPFGLAGRTVTAEPFEELLPGNHLTFRTVVGGVAPLFRMSTTVRLSADAVGVDDPPDVPAATATTANTAMPWTQLGVLIVLIAAVLLWRRLRRRRRREAAARLAAAREEGRQEGRREDRTDGRVEAADAPAGVGEGEARPDEIRVGTPDARHD